MPDPEPGCLDDNAVSAFVARALPDDEWARVAKHLDTCERCLALTCAVAGAPEHTDDDDSGASGGDALAKGARIGRYELVEMIGQGATGSVYVAIDPKLGRRIALKIVRSARFAEPDVQARLAREARAMAQIAHPNVIAVHDTGELADGVFIAMELFAGETLAAWQARDGRGAGEIVRAYAAAARGLAAAHAAGIVHRDFKPANTMIEPGGRVAVSDFGLALLDDPAASPADARVRLGTPRYMSPEQLAGATVDARTDQYSFAIALRDALAPHASSAIARALRPAIDRALAADPDARFPSIAALGDALDAALAPRRRRGRVLAAGAIVAVAAATAAIAIATTRTGDADRASAPRAWASFVPAPAHKLPPSPAAARIPVLFAHVANHTGDAELDDTLDAIAGEELARSAQVDIYAGAELDSAALQLGADSKDADALVAKIRAATGRDALVAHLDVAARGSGYDLELAAADPRLAGGAYRGHTDGVARADLPHAAIRLAAGLAVALGDDEPHPVVDLLSPSLAAVHAWAAGHRAELAGDYAAAETYYRAAIAADPDFARGHEALGGALYNESQHAAATAELARAVAHADHITPRRRLMMLGDYDGARGRYADSIAWYEQLLARWPGDSRAQISACATALDAQSWPLALELARAAAAAHPGLGVVESNLVLAELGNGAIADAVRDADAMQKDGKGGVPGANAALVAHALAGDLAGARAIADALVAIDQDAAAIAAADLAMFDGKPADAARGLRAYLATRKPGEAKGASLLLARALLRQGDRAGAHAAAMNAAADGDVRIEYDAAYVALAAGGAPADAAKQARAWMASELPEWRIAGHALAGDVALARGDARAALAEFDEAERHGPWWVMHARRAVAYGALGDRANAERERAWCAAHRGEIAIFMTPSASLIAELPAK